MLYTVGEMAKILGVASSTLRYYDKEGLLPFVERSGGGMRMFKDDDMQWLKIISCLKKTGMPLKDIKCYIEMSMQGDETVAQRLEIFEKQRDIVAKQMAELSQTLDLLNYKCWFYKTATEAGSTDIPRNTPNDALPNEFKAVRERLSQK